MFDLLTTPLVWTVPFLTGDHIWQTTAAEIIGVITGIICVWLTVRQNIISWPVGILNNLFLILLFIPEKLYADLLLQVIYIGLGIYGWNQWLRGGVGGTMLQVSHTPPSLWLLLGLIGVAGTLMMAWGLTQAAELMGAPPPSRIHWDSATAVTCLIAQWMLAKKLLESWILWIATNVSYIALYYSKDLYLLCGLQLLFIALSVQGYLQWKRSMEREPAVLTSR